MSAADILAWKAMAPRVRARFKGCGHTWRSITSRMGLGPDAKPTRIPADRIFDKLSNRITLPTSGCSSSSLKYDGGRSDLPK